MTAQIEPVQNRVVCMWKFDKNVDNVEQEIKYYSNWYIWLIYLTVCGGIIDLIPGGQDKTITSPNYPNDYDVDTQCVWLLRVSWTKEYLRACTLL